jgi:hypothetical protein
MSHAFRGAGETSQPADRAASKAEIAEAVGAPSTSTAEGRVNLMSEIAEDIQNEESYEGGEGD